MRYHSNKMKNINNVESIVIATNKNILDVINQRAITIITGKLRNITKFIMTLILRKRRRRWSLRVVLKLKIAIFAEDHIDSYIFLFSIIISYFAYEKSIFITLPSIKIIKKA